MNNLPKRQQIFWLPESKGESLLLKVSWFLVHYCLLQGLWQELLMLGEPSLSTVTSLLQELKTQWYGLKNLLNLLNHWIQVPRSCKGPWKSETSQSSQPYQLRCSQHSNNATRCRIQKRASQMTQFSAYFSDHLIQISIQQACNTLLKINPLKSPCCKPEDHVLANSSSWWQSCPLLKGMWLVSKTSDERRQSNVWLHAETSHRLHATRSFWLTMVAGFPCIALCSQHPH